MRGVSSTTTKATRAFTNALIPQDRNVLLRLVGFYEYTNALYRLEQLLKISTSEELIAINQLIEERDELAVFTNLARFVEPENTSLTQHGLGPGDQFERRGLAWVLALARVELAMMVAGFGTLQDPFEAVRPTRYEIDAYKELILDGAKTHYWALVRDPSFKAATRGSVMNPAILAASRRLLVARTIIRAAMKAGFGELSPDQSQELAYHRKKMDAIQIRLYQKIQSYLEKYVELSSTVQGPETRFVQACDRLLRAEAKERVRGRAKITPLGERVTKSTQIIR
ncbi:MAG: hypothetical protein MK165_19845 [Pirellulaceae bacterium]|nr:hypothetical protein [Pirellulaceae bacterium]